MSCSTQGAPLEFPYVSWSGELDSERVEHAGRILAARAIHSHQDVGNPVYFVDESKWLIKRKSERRLFQVRVLPDGQEITEQELTQDERRAVAVADWRTEWRWQNYLRSQPGGEGRRNRPARRFHCSPEPHQATLPRDASAGLPVIEERA